MIKAIRSGGQTGADRAALDAAIQLGISYGGWCPKGRIDEKGIIPAKYAALVEIAGDFKNEKENIDTRTRHNIRDSDGTLILVPKIPLPQSIKDGTVLTIEEVKIRRKPYLVLDVSRSAQENTESMIRWIKENQIRELNVAGPRESNAPGIYDSSLMFLEHALLELNNQCSLRARL